MAGQQGALLFAAVQQGPLVADHQHQAARAQHLAGAAQGQAEAVAGHLGRVGRGQRLVGLDQAAEQLQQALLATPRAHLGAVTVVEHQTADAVVVGQGGPAEQRGGLRGEHRLEAQAAAEEQPRALLDQQEYRTLALLVEQLGVRLLGACGDPPVDVAHVVAGLVDTHLVEVDAAAAQLRMVQADQRAAPQGAGEQLHLAEAVAHVQQFGEADHHPRQQRVGMHGGLRRPRPGRGCAGSPGPGRCRRPRPRRTG
ncbi:hypothetical protein D9M71_435910 [compost metagenome]